MTPFRSILATILLLTALPATADSLQSQLNDCATISDPDQRLSCYDNLATPDSAVALESKKMKRLSDSVGVKQKKPEEEIEESYGVTITDCEKAYNRISFKLDNGQIWRQKNEKWLSLKKCAGEGVITKDFFGYKLFIKALDKTIRVSRLR